MEIYQKKLNYFFLIGCVIDCVICEMDTTELKQEQTEQTEQTEQEQQLEHRARAMRLKMNERGMWRWALRGIVIQ